MYPKKIAGIWNIHIEVTLSKRYLKTREIPMDIPNSTTPAWLKRIHLEEFVDFTQIQWDKFAQVVWDRVRPKEQTKEYPKHVHPVQVLWSAARTCSACMQKRTMNIIAKTLSKRLPQRASKGEFDKKINLLRQ
jgi:hypothetical protein